MTLKLIELAKKLNAELRGDGQLKIKGVLRNFKFKENYITVLGPEDFNIPENLNPQKIAILTVNYKEGVNCLLVNHEEMVNKFVELLKLFEVKESFNRKIHPTAIIGEGVEIGKGVSIGAYCVIGDNVKIGDNSILYPNLIIYPEVKIGNNCKIHSGVVIRSGVEIGNNVEIDSNSSIGCSTLEKGIRKVYKGKLYTLPITGKIIIKDNVCIGPNTIIYKGLADESIIEEGTIIGGHVAINYGVKIGKNTRIYDQTGISYYVTIGEGTIICAKCGIDTATKINKKAYIVGGTMVRKNVKEREKIMGAFPPMEKNRWLKVQAIIKNLPEIRETLRKLKK